MGKFLSFVGVRVTGDIVRVGLGEGAPAIAQAGGWAARTAEIIVVSCNPVAMFTETSTTANQIVARHHFITRFWNVICFSLFVDLGRPGAEVPIGGYPQAGYYFIPEKTEMMYCTLLSRAGRLPMNRFSKFQT